MGTKVRRTLTEYCEKSIDENLSRIAINDGDIDRGDKDVNDMTTSLIKSMTNSKLYIYVKLTNDGIRFTYNKNVFYLKYTERGWVLTNSTVKAMMEKEEYINRWHKYDDFVSAPDDEESEPDTDNPFYKKIMSIFYKK